MQTACLTMLLMLFVMSAGCAPEPLPEEIDQVEPAENSPVGKDIVALPGVEIVEKAVSGALYERVSRRDFSDKPLKLEQAGMLLWSAGGVGVDGVTGPTRTIPSAGGTYPLDAYLVAGKVEGLEAGVYRYDYRNHALEQVKTVRRVHWL